MENVSAFHGHGKHLNNEKKFRRLLWKEHGQEITNANDII